MRIQGLGLDTDRKTVVVLGAGASRGASFVGGHGVQPPLDADFFTQAQRLTGTLTADDKALFQFIREEFGIASFPTLETFFTQVEAVNRFHHDFNIRGRVSTKFGKQLTTLRRLIPKVFAAAFEGKECDWHARLANSLRAEDAVLSFNYDCLIDEALAAEVPKRWRASKGYGFEIAEGTERWETTPGRGAPYKNPIRLLKPHGSLNWIISGEPAVHLSEPYGRGSANSIVPPTWDKSDVAEWPWNEVWREARRVLAQARQLVVIGYSVPVTDQLSQALLRADVSKLDGLVVVNPDPGARDRVLNLFSSALSTQSMIVELSEFRELARYLPPAQSEQLGSETERRLSKAESEVDWIEGRVQDIEDATEDQGVRLDEVETSLDEVLGVATAAEDRTQHSEGRLGDLEARVDSLQTYERD